MHEIFIHLGYREEAGMKIYGVLIAHAGIQSRKQQSTGRTKDYELRRWKEQGP